MLPRIAPRPARAGALLTMVAVLAACSGGARNSGTLPPAPPIGGGGTPSAQKVRLEMVIRGPHRKANLARRGMRPRFVSPSTDGVLVQAYPHGATQIPANLIAQNAVDVSSGSAACGGQSGYPRTCSVSIGVPATTSVTDDFVFTSYDAAPVGGSFPSGAHVLGIGSVLDQAIVANTNNVLTIYLGGVIAHLSGQAGFVSLPADGSAHSLSLVIDPSDYGNNPITAGSNDPYANPIVVSLSEAGGSGHASLSLNGGAGASSVTLTTSSDTVAVQYDGGGAVGYGASVTIAAPSVSGAGGASETVAVSPLFVSASTYSSGTRTLNLGANLASTVTLSELNASGAASVYTVTPSGCSNVASAGTPSGTQASASVSVTGGSTVSASGCTLAFSDGTSTVTANVTNSSGSGSVGVPPAVTITEWRIPTSSSFPQGITAGSDGALWFTECGGNKIGRIPTDAPTPNPASTATPNPDISEYPLPTANAYPHGITSGPDGALWFAECNANKIGRIPTDATPGSGAQITEYASGATPFGITTGPDGNLWYGNFNRNDVQSMSPAGTVLQTYTTATQYTDFFVTGPDGAVWFTECNAPGVIGRIKNGVLSEESVPNSSVGTSPAPYGIAVGSDGNIWFTDLDGHGGIGKVDVATFPATGSISEIALPGTSGLPFGITSGPDGALWFADRNNNAIGRIPTDATQTSDIAEYQLPSPSSNPVAIAKGPDGNLWFAESASGNIGRLVIGSSPTAERAMTHYPHRASSLPRLPRFLRRRHAPGEQGGE